MGNPGSDSLQPLGLYLCKMPGVRSSIIKKHANRESLSRSPMLYMDHEGSPISRHMQAPLIGKAYRLGQPESAETSYRARQREPKDFATRTLSSSVSRQLLPQHHSL